MKEKVLQQNRYFKSVERTNNHTANFDTNVYSIQVHFILDLGDEFRAFQPPIFKTSDVWNDVFT
jgi:hypothetical protein